jgi:Glycine zipper 2TM domain
MTRTLRNTIRLAILSGSLALTTAGSSALQAQQLTTKRTATPVRHHSLLKGAVAGAVAGHMTHRRHGALLGAAVGAEVQHHRNKTATKVHR